MTTKFKSLFKTYLMLTRTNFVVSGFLFLFFLLRLLNTQLGGYERITSLIIIIILKNHTCLSRLCAFLFLIKSFSWATLLLSKEYTSFSKTTLLQEGAVSTMYLPQPAFHLPRAQLHKRVSTNTCLAWKFFLDKNRITRQISTWFS